MHWAAVGRSVCRYLDAAAEEWLGWAYPPVERAIDESAWKEDEAEAYCHRCGDSVAPGEATPDGCATCRPGAELARGIGEGVIRLGPYVDPLQHWIRLVKYHGWSEMGDELGRRLGRAVSAANMIELEQTVIVPMPMPWQRRIYRGIDHAYVIAEGVARELRAPVVRVLAKAHHPPQVVLPPSERRRRGSRGLRVRRRLGGWPLHDLDVLLVDDVRTTGATLRAAARLLKALKPRRVICAVVAVSDSKARRQRKLQHHSIIQHAPYNPPLEPGAVQAAAAPSARA